METGGARCGGERWLRRLLDAAEDELRYGENPHQWGVLARAEAASDSPAPASFRARSCRTTTSEMPPARGVWCGTCRAAGRRGDQARQPVRGRSRRLHGRGLSQGPGHRSGVGLRRRDRRQPRGGRGIRRGGGRAVCRGGDRARRSTMRPARSLPKKKNLRVLEAAPASTGELVVRDVDGGFLIQAADAGWDGEERELATERAPAERESKALELAWRVVKHVGSNAIVVGAEDRILGIGAGQMSRVDAAKIAVAKAGGDRPRAGRQRCGLGRVLSVSRRGRGAARSRCARRDPARRLDPGQGRDRGLRPARRGHGADRAAALPALRERTCVSGRAPHAPQWTVPLQHPDPMAGGTPAPQKGVFPKAFNECHAPPHAVRIRVRFPDTAIDGASAAHRSDGRRDACPTKGQSSESTQRTARSAAPGPPAPVSRVLS